MSEILKAGIRFLGLAPRTLADIYTDIATIAGAIGAGERGEHVIAGMQARIDGIRERVSGKSRPKVFCEEWGKPIIASQAWVAELVEAAGGSFVGECGRSTSAGRNSGSESRCHRGRLVRRRRSRSAGKDNRGSRMAKHFRRGKRARVLHPRRVSEYSRADPARRA